MVTIKTLYGYCGDGMYRMGVGGWQLKVVDTKRYHACYSDRLYGWRIGRFVVRVFRLPRVEYIVCRKGKR